MYRATRLSEPALTVNTLDEPHGFVRSIVRLGLPVLALEAVDGRAQRAGAAGNGRFIRVKEAERRPKTTTVETVKRPKHKGQ